MTVHNIIRQMLAMIGVHTFDVADNLNNLNEASLDPTDRLFVVSQVNASLQEIFSRGPACIREREVSEVLRPPTTVTLDATQYSTTIANLTTYAAWMIGCTIRIDGDSQDNEVISSTSLLRPYMGTTDTGKSATVYADCIALNSAYSRVLEPVKLPRINHLRPSATKEDFYFWNMNPREVDGERLDGYGAFGSLQKTTGMPCIWFCEARYDGTSEYMPLRLRFNPMPDQAYAVTFRVKIKPTAITDANMGTDETTDTNIAIPLDWVESVLLPFCKCRMMAHPRFQGDPTVIQQLRDDRKQAIAIIEDTAPQTAQAQARFPRW